MPHPLWGTCLDNVVAFQKRNGGIQVTDPGLMPPVLRRRWRLFNFLLRLAGRKDRLHVMMIDNSTSGGSQETGAYAHSGKLDTMHNALLLRIKKYQIKKSRPFLLPGVYESIRGLFVSYPTYTVSMFKKYFGKSFLIRVHDNNAFATFWTLELLLEAYANDTGKLHEIHVEDAVRALMQFHDQTREQDDPLFVFWKQHTVGEHPVVFPSNLMPFYRLFMQFDTGINKVKGILQKIRPNRRNAGGHPSHEPKRSSAAFSLPADFDDASLNWSLGSCLSGVQGRLS